MKRTENCPKCGSLEIGVVNVPAEDDRATMFRHQPAAKVIEDDLDGDVYVAVGRLEAWVCTKCGYYELYVKNPSTVPFEELVGFRWIHPKTPKAGPYR